MSRTPERFGTGMIEGVAGPETANNAYATAALIPLFTLGIPGSPTVAIIMGAFMMKGLIPGPFLFRDHAEVAWGVIASLCVGNVILLILNLPLIPLWVKILKIPRPILFAFILGFCVIGAYSINSEMFDVGLMAAFGVLGYLLKKLDIPLAPLILTLILGPLMEQSLRQSLEISRGDFSILFTRPISAALIVIAAVFAVRVEPADRGERPRRRLGGLSRRPADPRSAAGGERGAGLAGDEAAVEPAAGEERVVGPGLDDAPLVEDDDPVGVAHGREAVGDDDRRPVPREHVEGAAHRLLAHRVEVRRRLVEDQHGRVLQEGPRDGHPLALAARELGAPLAHHRVEALGQRGDELAERRALDGRQRTSASEAPGRASRMFARSVSLKR